MDLNLIDFQTEELSETEQKNVSGGIDAGIVLGVIGAFTGGLAVGYAIVHLFSK